MTTAKSGGQKQKKTSNTRYSKRDLEYIESNYKLLSASVMAKKLGRTELALRDKMGRMGIRLGGLSKRPNHVWSKKDIAYLKAMYVLETDAIIAERLGVSRVCVLRQRKKLGLSIKDNAKDIERGGYNQIKVGGERVWEHRHIVSESVGRPLSKKERVHHIDLQKLNNDIDNLYLCKNEREHATVHWDLNRVASELVAKKLILFDKKTGKYGMSSLILELLKRI